MKINWGTSIVIAFCCFMAFILYFVFRVQGNPKYDNELVVEEYYKKDTRYSEEMAKLQNAAQLAEQPSINVANHGIAITFPQQIADQHPKGELSFYRPSAKKLDFGLPLQLSGETMLVPQKDLAGGRWDIALAWEAEGKEYLIRKSIYID